MSVLKVIEVLQFRYKLGRCHSKGVAKAAPLIIRSVYVKDQSAAVSGGEITEYRVNLKLTFELE
jgi:flavin-binding protein dodecin